MIYKNMLLLATMAALSPLITACSTTGGEDLTPLPKEAHVPVDPDDALLVAAIQQHLVNSKGPKNSQYEYVRVDLNNDGLREGLVMFNLPHSYWCGWNGCTMAIFQAGDNDFGLVSETARLRGPLVIGQSSTNGWEDILVRLSGNDDADRSIVLKYDGNAYPADPTGQEEAPYDIASANGMRIFP